MKAYFSNPQQVQVFQKTRKCNCFCSEIWLKDIKMKYPLLAILSLFVFVKNIPAQVVDVVVESSAILASQEVLFRIVCKSEQDLEITVFTEGCLVSHQNSILPADTHPFKFSLANCPPGKFFILVTGNGIHIEKEFTVKATR